MQRHISCKCEYNFDRENLTQIKTGITINPRLNTNIRKNLILAMNIIFGILLHAVVKVVNM